MGGAHPECGRCPARRGGRPGLAADRTRACPRARFRQRCSVPAGMDPALTLDQLRTEVTNERIDTILLALTDMQGRLQGKRIVAQHFLDEVARPRRRGVQLPARRRRRDEHRRRLRDELVGARLRRLRDGPGPLDPAPRSRGTRRPRCASPTCAGAPRSPSSRRRARSCGRSWSVSRSAASRPSPPPSSSSSSSRTPTRRRSRRATATSSRPTSTTSTTRCSARRGWRS